MEKVFQYHQIDLGNKVGQNFIKNIRENLIVVLELNEKNELGLKLSIDKDIAFNTLSEFIKLSIISNNPFSNNYPSTSIGSTDMKNLTPKEIEIMEKLSEGKSLKEISNDLSMCIDTAKTHIKSIYKKLNVRKVSKAVIEYLKLKGMFQHSVADIYFDLSKLGFNKELKLIFNEYFIQENSSN
jgi:DNA-binding CsgD family transcriptional regulator